MWSAGSAGLAGLAGGSRGASTGRAAGLAHGCRRRIRRRRGRRVRAFVVLPPKRLVDLEQRLLLPLGERAVAHHRGRYVAVAVPLVEDPGLDVEGLGGDAQRLGDLLQDLGAGLAEAAFD